MNARAILHMLLIAAVAGVGLTPAAVCAMPPECPMVQARAGSPCCDAARPADGVQQASCRPVTVATIVPAIVVAASALPILLVMPLSPVPSPLRGEGQSEGATLLSASPVPRFLLTHTFRL